MRPRVSISGFRSVSLPVIGKRRRGSARMENMNEDGFEGVGAALKAALEKYENMMERYFKMKAEQHAESQYVKRLRLEKEIAELKAKEQQLILEKHAFDAMQSCQVRQLEIMQEGQRSQTIMLQTLVANIAGMQQKLIEKLSSPTDGEDGVA